MTDAVAGVINTKDAQVFGQTDVYIEGRRSQVRTQETNLGNLSNDANPAEARDVDLTVAVSIKNGGGIRDSIGSVAEDGTPQPPAANPAAGKQFGDISQLDVENSLRFNNLLSVATIMAAQLKVVLEHAVAATAAGATPGQFPQVGGLAFSFDSARTAQVIAGNAGTGVATVTTAGQRVRSVALTGASGVVTDVVVRDGVVAGDPNRLVRLVTLNFMLDDPDNDGRDGDNYPLPSFDQNRVNLTNGGEQAALAEYLQETFPATGPNARAFADAETPPARDRRIQNLAARPDGVLPNATVQFSSATYDVVEGQPFANVTVTRSGNAADTVTVNYATSNGTATAGQDYAATAGTLTFGPGDTSESFMVPITDDAAFEPLPNETINLTLTLANPSNATLGGPSTAVVRIADNEPRSITVNDVSVVEGNVGTRAATFTVRLSAASGLPVAVQYATSDGQSVQGSDYTPVNGVLAFAPGETQKTVTVLVNGDTRFEPGDFFFLNLFNVGNAILADSSGRGTIVNDDPGPRPPELTINNVTRAEGNSGLTAFTFTVRLSRASSSPVTVRYGTQNITALFNVDYHAIGGTLSFARGQTARTLTVFVRGDRKPAPADPTERFALTLFQPTSAVIADPLGIGTILNDD